MKLSRLAAVLLFAVVFAFAALAQNPNANEHAFVRDAQRPPNLPPPPPPVPVPQDPTPGVSHGRSGGSGTDAEAQTTPSEGQTQGSRRPGQVGTFGLTGSTAGDIFLDSAPSPYASSGIFMRATTGAAPNISAKLGPWTTTPSTFSIFDSNDSLLLSVGSDGLTQIVRDQGAATILRVRNASTGDLAVSRVQFFESDTAKVELNRIGSGYTAGVGGVNAFQIWNYAAAPIVFGTSSTERLRIHSNGFITAGATNQLARFAAVESRDAHLAFSVVKPALIEANTTQTDYAATVQVQGYVNAGVTNSGDMVALRTEAFLSGNGTLARSLGLIVDSGVHPSYTGTLSDATGAMIRITRPANATITRGVALVIPDVAATTGYAVWQDAANDMNYFGGKVGIGVSAPEHALHVNGNIYATGDITGLKVIGSVYQDVAEWVPATMDMAPGTVVILNPEAVNQVMPSSAPYDTTVAGVVSAQPGVLLGVAGDDKEQIATTGRVKVRVDATKAPIRVGDLLVTSSKPGMAMRSEAMEINGRRFHQPGTIIGKALEPLAGGEGEILVLLSMQ